MNIFILHEDPITSAHYHCDQHIHKMVLESAQMFSTAAFYLLPAHILAALKGRIYKPSYPNHPCNLWLREYPEAWKFDYLYHLAKTLDSIRQDFQNSSEHSSIPVIETCHAFLSDAFPPNRFPPYREFIRAMPPIWKHNASISTIEAYRRYYRAKHQFWLEKDRIGMTWNGREIPNFMQDLIAS